MQMKDFDLFASSLSDIDREIAAHIYSQKMQAGHTFQSASAPAHKLNPRDFPFQGMKKGYNITSFRVREKPVGVAWVEGLLSFTLSYIS